MSFQFRLGTCRASLLLLLAAGCGRPHPEPSDAKSPSESETAVLGQASRSLLERAPFEIVDDPGRLIPDELIGFGTAAGGAWAKQPVLVDDDFLLDAYNTRSGVRLQANTPQTRQISAWMSGPRNSRTAPDAVEARLILNGIVLGQVELHEQPRWVSIEAPAEAWVRGENLFEVQVARTYPAAPAKVGFAMGEIRYGDPREVTFGEGSLQLPPETAAAYRFEPLGPGTLTVKGRIELGDERAGRLKLNFDSGSQTGPAKSVSIGLDEDEISFERQFDVRVTGEPSTLRLEFEAGPTARLVVEALDLIEPAGLARPNLIWVAIDTLAAQHLDLYGYGRETAPNLTKLAESSVVFDRAWANAPWTLASFFASLSGLYPSAHDLDSDRETKGFESMWERRLLAPSRWTLAEALQAGGWRTGAFVDHTWLIESYGVDQGFETFDHSAGWISNTDRQAGFSSTLAGGLKWQAELPSKYPFFLFVHGFDVHGPYASKREWREKIRAQQRPMSLPESLPAGGVKAFDVIPDYVTRVHAKGGQDKLPDRMDPGPIVDAYDAGIAEVDDKLGRFFEELEARGLLETSIIVIFSDHGEAMVQHHRPFGHGMLHEEISHVPLIVRLPGGAQGGLRIQDQVQLVDLMPTLLELCGLESERPLLHGRSLVPLMEGKSLAPVPAMTEGGGLGQQAVISEGWKLIRQNPHDGAMTMRLSYPYLNPEWVSENAPELIGNGLTADRLRTVTARFGSKGKLDQALHKELDPLYYELYHLNEDPRELNDLSTQLPDKVAELEALLEAELSRAAQARAAVKITGEPPPLADEQIEILRAAGYIDR